MIKEKTLHLFEGFGIELEYMIVDGDTLAVLPVCDELLREVAGSYSNEFEKDDICWSNELALHVVELKTCGPAASLSALSPLFADDITRINTILGRHNGCLLPSAAHPWMNPHTESRLWPHGDRQIYQAYDRIFDCRGHGWVNLQSCHLNLPFCGDDEFGRLHAAIRLILPIIPALAASSPVLDGRFSGFRDYRMEYYRTNSRRVPSVTGSIIPEPVFTGEEYQKFILEPLYRDISPHDPDGVLQHEWLNARGAIARFDRNAIEIRVIDVQECPRADLAVAAAIVGAVRFLVEECWIDYTRQKGWSAESLREILLTTVRDSERAVIGNRDYLRVFGLESAEDVTAGQLWRHILADASIDRELSGALEVILDRGSLASRMLARMGRDIHRKALEGLFMELRSSLAENRIFVP